MSLAEYELEKPTERRRFQWMARAAMELKTDVWLLKLWLEGY